MSGQALDEAGLARLLDRPEVRRVLAALAAEGEATRLVGGCVRDALLGRAGDDIDLTTTLRPQAVMAKVEAAGLRAIPTGIEHGTVTVLAGEAAFEVTTLREDVETDGRHAVVRFGRDFALDAQRRDFTINALSLAPDGTLHDTTGGIEDLKAGRVRFIGEARTRIREDALRILRFFRFHARYGAGPPDPEGLSACIAARDALDGLSRERIRAELLKLLSAPGAPAAVEPLSETGLLMRLIGGLGDLGRFIRVVAQGTGTSAIERLAALAMWSDIDAGRLEADLRLSKVEHAALAAYGRALGALHGRATIDATEMRRLAADHDRAALGLAYGATQRERNPVVTPEAGSYLDDLVSGRVTAPKFPLTGADLVARGIRPGPEIGRRLARARALWLDIGCPEDAAARETLLERATG
ncbi:poly(A) polymerase [Methylobacterium sp. Leaf104]|uniref:CCA tRNA nucleotidyltransferase n=1 Tax=Methylobacterium TaxID=407 RepID=UPI0006FA6770|nr:CCA tRNA nucleotidyltransferase [Methylobacterium sp. Leaf104]KQP42672.1 poly(A) polymerase [Methylobacterium sp. Leaf104]MCI9878762.1 CCA tRNA nucleotidyltransferase [Methylobacterium goesingense]